jgi:prophage DNA circulation protein
VPFQVDSSSWEPGRNTVTLYFVQRDKRFVEDLGRKTRQFTIDAWVCAHLNNDFNPWPQRDALILAFETAGVGTFVHPYYGELTGYASARITESGVSQGGYVKFEITFTESGELDFTAVNVVDMLSNSVDLSNEVVFASANDFNQVWTVADSASFVLKNANAAVRQLSSAYKLAVGLADGNISAYQQALSKLGLADINGVITNGLQLASNLSILQQQVSKLFEPENIPVSASAAQTQSRVKDQNNITALNFLARSLFVSEYARRAVDLSTGSDRYVVDSVALRGSPELTSRQDLQQSRLKAVTVITDLIYDLSDAEIFEDTRAQLIALRAAVVEHMTVEGENLGNTFIKTYSVDMPMLAVSYEFYGVLRDDEINARNEVPNPLFVERNSAIELVTEL